MLILSDNASFAGCLIRVRRIGGLKMRQREKARWIRNDRLLGVPVTEVNPAGLRSLDELREQQLTSLESFFVGYDRAQGRELKPAGRFGVREANRILKNSMRG